MSRVERRERPDRGLADSAASRPRRPPRTGRRRRVAGRPTPRWPPRPLAPHRRCELRPDRPRRRARREPGDAAAGPRAGRPSSPRPPPNRRDQQLGPSRSRMPPIEASPASSTTSFAMRTRSTPASTATSACQASATVMAHAPASACRRKIAGDIVVLPCGANEIPHASQKSASVAMSWARAARAARTPAAGSTGRRGRGRSAVVHRGAGHGLSRRAAGCAGGRGRRWRRAPPRSVLGRRRMNGSSVCVSSPER